MTVHHIPFPEIPWQSQASGQRQKIASQNGRQIRLMELTPEFVEPDWCSKGHIGMVLEGGMELTFEHQTLTYQAGDAFLISPGVADRHRARALTPVVRMIMFEELEK